jgi:hypothetical protein
MHFRSASLLCAVLGALTYASTASAEQQARRLVVLHRGGKDIAEATRVEIDQLVLEAVSEPGRFSTAHVSPVPFEDVELAADCRSRDDDCMRRIAATLEADWLLVRELARDASGGTRLALIAHDGRLADLPRRAEALIPAVGEPTAKQVVAPLVERLYPAEPAVLTPVPAPAATRFEPASAPAEAVPMRSSRAARSVGWTATAVASGLLLAGIAIGAESHQDTRFYQRVEVHDASDVDRAADLLGRARQHARTANGLFIGGAIAGVAGLATLLWASLRRRSERRALEVGVAPVRAGFSLSLGGAW